MIRSSKSLFALGALLAGTLLQPGDARGEGYLLDAFGSVPLRDAGSERLAWSGARITNGHSQKTLAEAADRIEIFVGPKSIVAARGVSQLVAIAFDRHGNLVEDGTAATFKFGAREYVASAQHGVASAMLPAPSEARHYFVAAQVDGRQSSRGDIDVVADLETAMPRLDILQQAVELESLTEISSVPLIDAFGNFVPDGIYSTFIFSHPDGSSSLLPAPIIETRARAKFLARDVSGEGLVAMTIGAQKSPSSDLSITSLLKSVAIPVDLEVAADLGLVVLKAGPFETDAGFLLPDGAPISIRIEGESGRLWAQDGWLFDGMAIRLVPLDASDFPFSVLISTALGTEFVRLTPNGLGRFAPIEAR